MSAGIVTFTEVASPGAAPHVKLPTPAYPPAIPGYNRQLKNEFNPEKAKQVYLGGELAGKTAISYLPIDALKKPLMQQLDTKPLAANLSGLKEAIANAVATAGGDEVAELLRLDRMFAKKVSA